MAFAQSTPYIGFGTILWLLGFAGFGILLGGISGLQQACGGSNATSINQMGAVGYLSAVSCDRFFSMDWFILFFHFFVWLLVAIFLFSRKVHIGRPMLTALLAIASTLLMFQANTWYRINGVPQNISSSFTARGRTVFAGAIVASIADLALLILLGIQDDEGAERGTRYKETTTPTGAYTTTATTTATPVATTTAAPPVTATTV